MSHDPASNANSTPPPENTRSVGQVEFLAEDALATLAHLAPTNPAAKEALRRLKHRFCEGDCL